MSDTPAPAPWEADLAQAFEDDAVRTQVDEFLRGKVQPHVTKLETNYAETENARLLYDSLNGDNAPETFLELSAALFGDEGAEKILAALQAEEAAATPPTTPEIPAVTEPPATPPADADPWGALPPELREVADDYTARKNADAYAAEVAKVKQRDDIDAEKFDEDEFALSVLAHDGDIERAVPHYLERMTKWSPAPTPPAEAPPTLGSQPGAGGGDAPAPVAENYNTLDAAVDAYLAEIKGGPPTPVGTV